MDFSISTGSFPVRVNTWREEQWYTKEFQQSVQVRDIAAWIKALLPPAAQEHFRLRQGEKLIYDEADPAATGSHVLASAASITPYGCMLRLDLACEVPWNMVLVFAKYVTQSTSESQRIFNSSALRVPVTVSASMTVGDLLDIAEAKAGKPWHILYYGHLLDNRDRDKPLTTLGCTREFVVSTGLILSPSSATDTATGFDRIVVEYSRGGLELFVYLPTGPSRTLRVSAQTSVENFKCVPLFGFLPTVLS